MAESITERKKTFKPKEIIKADDHKAEMQHLVTSYDGKTAKLKTLVVRTGLNDMRWNRELLVSLEDGQTVYIHPDQKNVEAGYVRVIHSDHMAVSVFDRTHFN